MGLSAGGASVEYLLMSDLSKGTVITFFLYEINRYNPAFLYVLMFVVQHCDVSGLLALTNR